MNEKTLNSQKLIVEISVAFTGNIFYTKLFQHTQAQKLPFSQEFQQRVEHIPHG